MVFIPDSYKNLPFELVRQDLWICCKLETDENKTPINANMGKVPLTRELNKNHFALSTDGDNEPGSAKKTWSSFIKAVGALNENSPITEGIGFILLPENRIICIDLDKCYNGDGSIKKYATDMVNIFGSYCEKSVSKKGLHIFLKIRPEFGDTASFSLSKRTGIINEEEVSLEVFRQERYIWVTGDIIEPETKPITTLNESQEKYLLDFMKKMDDLKKEKAVVTLANRLKKFKPESTEPIIENSEFPFTLFDVCKIKDALSYRNKEELDADATESYSDQWYNCETRSVASAAVEHPEFEAQIYKVWDEWCKSLDDGSYDQVRNLNEWDKAKSQYQRGNKVTLGTLFHLAQACGFKAKDNYEWTQDGVITHCQSAKSKYDSIEPAGFCSGEEDPVEIKNMLGDDIIKKCISGTMVGEFADILANFTRPPTPIQIPLVQTIFALGCALSRNKDGMDNSNMIDPWGAHRAKVRIYGTFNPTTCSIYTLIAAPAGFGKNVSGINMVLKRGGIECINDASAEGLIDACEDDPNLGLIIDEFQSILNPTVNDRKLVSILKTAYSSYDHKKSLSKNSLKQSKGKQRTVRYLSPSILACIQPASLSRNLYQESLEDGFIQRFLICFYKESIVPPRFNFVDASRLTEIIKYYGNIQGDLFMSDYQKEYNAIYDGIVHDDPEKVMEARYINIYAPKLAIMLQGGLHIEPSTWERVSWLLKVFIQNYYLALQGTYENKFDAGEHNKVEKLIAFVKSRCKEGRPPNTRDIAREGKVDAKRYTDYINICLERGDIKRGADKRFYFVGVTRTVFTNVSGVNIPPISVQTCNSSSDTTLVFINNTTAQTSTVFVDEFSEDEDIAFSPELEDIIDAEDEPEELRLQSQIQNLLDLDLNLTPQKEEDDPLSEFWLFN
jgi:hypothetical protein